MIRKIQGILQGFHPPIFLSLALRRLVISSVPKTSDTLFINETYNISRHTLTSIHIALLTGVQTAQTLNFPGNSSEVIPTAHRPFGNVGSYAPRSPPPSHQQSPSHMTSGYASASPLQSVNYSHQNSAPAYGYPPPPGYSPSSPVYSSYSTSPYNHPLPLEANRQRTWWYNPHHAGAPLLQSFDGTVEYQRNYSAPYSMPPQINPIHPSTPLPPMSPPPSPPLPGPSSPERRLGVGLASGSGSRAGKKSLVRRSYHPNPPSYRSDWVMWAGNIPTNAVHNELWRFFTSFPESTSDASAKSGVLSIFLISRSNCAFINYEEESYLKVAIDHFNGCSLRPGDPRCPKLVCRMRNTDDDLKAGVGGQRGVGMHTLWVKERKDKSILRTEASSDSHDAPSMLPDKSPRSISSDGASGTRHRPQSMTSSSSYTSTNSSFLARFFSQRYFILKSLTQVMIIFLFQSMRHCLTTLVQADLDFSKENGLWATQRHNEEILDQAFRTSQNVYLIFSANKSGEFYGYARMAGPIRRGGHKVTWALRNSETSSSRPSSFSAGSVRGDGSAHASTQDGNLYFTAVSNRLVDNATFSMTEGTPKGGSDTSSVRYFENVHSAPAELEIVHKKTTPRASSGRNSLDYPLLTPLMCDEPTPDDFELDSMAPVRAMRSKRRESPLEIVVEEAERHGDDATSAKDVEKREKRDDWGQPFKVEWLSTEKISFQKTRHLRNPWNHMREVKVSRDGTELESTVGRKLISDWAVLAAM
ncbi:hypothetical protein C0992_004114 [Termitomyces sp. T32_za158]|nr:hypothetical protein C0992_004114 [Termitomyces sp. T32_za158]